MLSILLSVARSDATFSVVAVDERSGQVGIALASCSAALGFPDIEDQLWAGTPRVGAVVGQSFFFDNRRAGFLALLGEGVRPADAVARYVYSNAPDADPLAPAYDPRLLEPPGVEPGRQYGLVGFGVRAAAFTGAGEDPLLGTPHERGDVQGRYGRFRFSIQGNTLTPPLDHGEPRLLLDMRQGIRTKKRIVCDDLAERLDRALLAAIVHGGGDRRCVDGNPGANPDPRLRGISSNQAFLRVDDPARGTVVDLRYVCPDFTDAAHCEDAVGALTRRYAEWRGLAGCR